MPYARTAFSLLPGWSPSTRHPGPRHRQPLASLHMDKALQCVTLWAADSLMRADTASLKRVAGMCHHKGGKAAGGRFTAMQDKEEVHDQQPNPPNPVS
mmetsp:Transcript_115080/g.200282  ORF Transcript_115080/g.200282 Transcript_115080/m.200282 type:complete len:98 (+) Transcript_115080:235-528(+)